MTCAGEATLTLEYLILDAFQREFFALLFAQKHGFEVADVVLNRLRLGFGEICEKCQRRGGLNRNHNQHKTNNNNNQFYFLWKPFYFRGTVVTEQLYKSTKLLELTDID